MTEIEDKKEDFPDEKQENIITEKKFICEFCKKEYKSEKPYKKHIENCKNNENPEEKKENSGIEFSEFSISTDEINIEDKKILDEFTPIKEKKKEKKKKRKKRKIPNYGALAAEIVAGVDKKKGFDKIPGRKDNLELWGSAIDDVMDQYDLDADPKLILIVATIPIAAPYIFEEIQKMRKRKIEKKKKFINRGKNE